MTELTKLYPMVQIKKNTWEIDEFDCASIFLLIGTERRWSLTAAWVLAICAAQSR